jgi:hypothetical protein
MNDPFEWGRLLPDIEGFKAPPPPPDQRHIGIGRESYHQYRLKDELSEELRRCCMACLSVGDRSPFGEGAARARMWAQYASNHAGVCIAFDLPALLDAFMRLVDNTGKNGCHGPVRYLQKGQTRRPSLKFAYSDIKDATVPVFVEREFPNVVEQLYFTKSWDWGTETEYRLLLQGQPVEDKYVFIDVAKAVSAVFCGTDFPDARVRDLESRCPKHWESSRVYRIHWDLGVAKAALIRFPGGSLPDWSIPPSP